MSIFEAVKQSVTTRQAAERYGIRVERNGMCRCPFHDDSTPGFAGSEARKPQFCWHSILLFRMRMARAK